MFVKICKLFIQKTQIQHAEMTSVSEQSLNNET